MYPFHGLIKTYDIHQRAIVRFTVINENELGEEYSKKYLKWELAKLTSLSWAQIIMPNQGRIIRSLDH